jgi:hypothetical protein
MFPDLFEATKIYWRKLDDLEASYQKGEVSLEEVDAQVAKLMADLAQERRVVFAQVWRSLQNQLSEQREVILGFTSLVLAVYLWFFIRPIV